MPKQNSFQNYDYDLLSLADHLVMPRLQYLSTPPLLFSTISLLHSEAIHRFFPKDICIDEVQQTHTK